MLSIVELFMKKNKTMKPRFFNRCMLFTPNPLSLSERGNTVAEQYSAKPEKLLCLKEWLKREILAAVPELVYYTVYSNGLDQCKLQSMVNKVLQGEHYRSIW